MSLTDAQQVNLTLNGLFEPVANSPADMANALQEELFTWRKTAADTNATDATAEFSFAGITRRAKLVSATYYAENTLTSSDTTYATLTLSSRDGKGGSALNLGDTLTKTAANGGTGNWNQWGAITMTANAFDPNNAVIPAGGLLTFKIAKASTGVAVPAGTLFVRIQYL